MKRLVAIAAPFWFLTACDAPPTYVSVQQPPVQEPPVQQPPVEEPGELVWDDFSLQPVGAAQQWNIIGNITALTGDACWSPVTPDNPLYDVLQNRSGDPLTGADYFWDLLLDRSGEQLWLRFGNFDDFADYVGTVSGNEFTAVQTEPISTRIGCTDARRSAVVVTGRMAGRFTDDGRSLTAEQVASYTLDDGGTFEVHSRWRATAR